MFFESWRFFFKKKGIFRLNIPILFLFFRTLAQSRAPRNFNPQLSFNERVSENFPLSVAQVWQVRVLSGFLLLPQGLQSSSTAGTLKQSQKSRTCAIGENVADLL
jgi:hypothetical protein